MRLRLKQQRLLDLLAASPLSQNHWAIKLELSRGHWSEIVNGKHPYPSARTRLRLVEGLGVPVDELFDIETGGAPWADTDFRRAIADRYLVDTELGEGGMGAVYLARDVRHGRVVAVKVISPEIVSGIGLSQFQREVSTVAQLHHPNILPLFDSGEAAGHPFFVMPRVRGGSLRARLDSRTRLGLDETLRLVRGIAAALHHAHLEHVLHCDVKPENVLLHDDHPWVSDFGIARKLRSEVNEWPRREGFDISAGTPAYVSPEQASGERDLDARSDVYSLGCMTFEMLSGRAPFEGTSTRQVVARRFMEPPPPLRDLAPELPGAVQSVLERAMALPRERRPESAIAFAGELRAAATSHSRVLVAAGVAAARVAGRVRRTLSIPATRPLGGLVRDLSDDLAYSVRGLRRAPGFAAVVIATLGLALGANATMFGIVDRLLLRPPPHIANPGQVMRVEVSRYFQGGLRQPAPALSYPAFTDLRDQARSFRSVAALDENEISYGTGADSRELSAVFVTGQYFSLLGVRPEVGRFFGEEEDVLPSGVPVAVLGHAFWRTAFGEARDAVGRSVTLGGRSYQVVGVAPARFTGTQLRNVDVWLPLSAAAGPAAPGGSTGWQTSRGWQTFRVIARLREGTTEEAATLDATRAYQQGHAEFQEYERRAVVRLGLLVGARDASRQPGASGSARVASAVPRVAGWLAGMAFIVLLIACANVANLMLARGLARSGEIAVRRALGGGRGRLLRQFATESLVLAGLGCLAGLALAHWGGGFVRSALLPGTSFDARPLDARVLVVTAAATLFAALTAGVLPLLRGTRGNLAAALHGASRGAVGYPKRLLGALLVTQVGLATALLVGAGLFVRSLQRVQALDLGFAPGEMLLLNANQVRTVMGDSETVAFQRAALERVRMIPGVLGAGLAVGAPFRTNYAASLRVPGRDSLPRLAGGGPYYFRVSAGALETMQARLLRGRLFSDAEDRIGAEPVVVISERTARTLWPEQDPLGQCVILSRRPCARVVGVVADLHRQGLVEDPFYTVFVPLGAWGDGIVPELMMIRVAGPPERMVEPLRRELLALRGGLPYLAIDPYEELIAPQARSWRLGATMFSAFGLLSLVIAAIGVYGVLSFSVVQRLPELGIRAALGASPGAVLRLVVLGGLGTALAGLAGVGLLALLLAGRLGPLLFETSPRDPLAYLVAAGAITLMAIAACLLPGLRASRADPLSALRAE